MLVPRLVPSSVAAVELYFPDYRVFGNGAGHAFLSGMFSCAARLGQGEFIHVLVSFIPDDTFGTVSRRLIWFW